MQSPRVQSKDLTGTYNFVTTQKTVYLPNFVLNFLSIKNTIVLVYIIIICLQGGGGTNRAGMYCIYINICILRNINVYIISLITHCK